MVRGWRESSGRTTAAVYSLLKRPLKNMRENNEQKK